MSVANLTAIIASAVAVVTAAVAAWQAVLAGRSAAASRRQAIAAEEQTKLLREQLTVLQDERITRDVEGQRDLIVHVLEDGVHLLNVCEALLGVARKAGTTQFKQLYGQLIDGSGKLNGRLIRLRMLHGAIEVRDLAEDLTSCSEILISEFRMFVDASGLFARGDDHLARLATRRLDQEMGRLSTYATAGHVPPSEPLRTSAINVVSTKEVSYSELPPEVLQELLKQNP
jgi:hypothetical protein